MYSGLRIVRARAMDVLSLVKQMLVNALIGHLTPQLHCILKMVHDDYVIAVVCELMFGEQYYISRPLAGRLKLPDRIQSVVVP
jgi:hypothetical protein